LGVAEGGRLCRKVAILMEHWARIPVSLIRDFVGLRGGGQGDGGMVPRSGGTVPGRVEGCIRWVSVGGPGGLATEKSGSPWGGRRVSRVKGVVRPRGCAQRGGGTVGERVRGAGG